MNSAEPAKTSFVLLLLAFDNFFSFRFMPDILYWKPMEPLGSSMTFLSLARSQEQRSQVRIFRYNTCIIPIRRPAYLENCLKVIQIEMQHRSGAIFLDCAFV